MYKVIQTLCIPLIFLGLLTACKTESEDMSVTEEDTQELSVSFVIGEVTHTYNNRTETIRVGMQLGQGSTISTKGDDAACTLQTPSGTLVRLSGNTELLLDQLYKDDKLNIEKTGLELMAGSVLVKASTMLKNDEFNVRTRTAVAGVRGTQFTVSYDQNGETRVAVSTGRVAVSRNVAVSLPEDLQKHQNAVNLAVQKESEVIINADQKITISRAENQAYQQEMQQSIDRQLPELRKLPESQAGTELVQQARHTAVQIRPEPVISQPATKDRQQFKTIETLGTPSEKQTVQTTPAETRVVPAGREASTAPDSVNHTPDPVPVRMPGEIRDERFP